MKERGVPVDSDDMIVDEPTLIDHGILSHLISSYDTKWIGLCELPFTYVLSPLFVKIGTVSIPAYH